MRDMAQAFAKAEQATGFPALVALAVSACETGWWKSLTGDYNYWGITRPPAFPGDPKSKWCATTEYTRTSSRFRDDERSTAKPIPGKPGWYTMHRWFASYASLDESVSAYIGLITNAMRYHPAWLAYQKSHDPYQFLSDICDAGYATGPAKTVELAIAHQQNVLHAVDMAKRDIANG